MILVVVNVFVFFLNWMKVSPVFLCYLRSWCFGWYSIMLRKYPLDSVVLGVKYMKAEFPNAFIIKCCEIRRNFFFECLRTGKGDEVALLKWPRLCFMKVLCSGRGTDFHFSSKGHLGHCVQDTKTRVLIIAPSPESSGVGYLTTSLPSI